jgi:hypothetical protein
MVIEAGSFSSGYWNNGLALTADSASMAIASGAAQPMIAAGAAPMYAPAPANLQVEAAKSGRAGCKICCNKIDKDTMRIGKVRQSPVRFPEHHSPRPRQESFNGQYTSVSWHHLTCFNLSKVATGDDLAGFSLLSAAQQTEVATRLGQPGQKFIACGTAQPTTAAEVAPIAAPTPAKSKRKLQAAAKKAAAKKSKKAKTAVEAF